MIALSLLLALVAAGQRKVETHGAEDRVAQLKAALIAVRETHPDALRRSFEYARVLEQGACSSEVERLKLDCLITAARRYCRNKDPQETRRCQTTMDVVVSQVLAQGRMISTERRYELMKGSKDFRAALGGEIRRIEGALAVDFRLRTGDAEGDDQLASNIDRYCLETADATSQPWQICASSLVWFISSP